ncbi:hypothetical protein HY385_01685 [Candidatus Daviesbacteria bacterium]|nr:hypothetical protein [Candidatus Daviesbacteria bacterium]
MTSVEGPTWPFQGEITREEVASYGWIIALAQNLSLAGIKDWDEAFRLSDKALMLKRHIGPKTIDRLRHFQIDVQTLVERKRMAPATPHVIELLPDDEPVTHKGRGLIIVSGVPIAFIDANVNAKIVALFREHTTKEPILGLTEVPLPKLEQAVDFLNQFSLSLELRTDPKIHLEVPPTTYIRITRFQDNISRFSLL